MTIRFWHPAEHARHHLLAAQPARAAGGRVKYLFFWGHQFGDEAIAAQMLTAPHPGAVKALAGGSTTSTRPPGMRTAFDLVAAGNVAKFSQHPDLGRYLSRTGSRVLVEASPMDRVWGIGLSATDPRAHDPAQWRGRNLLGFALMHARAQLATA
ncbi:NADAR family protein [Micromonospora chalcea]